MMILDSIEDIDLIEPYRLQTVDILYEEEDGLIMIERKSQAVMISMNDIEKFKRLYQQFHLDSYDLYNVKQKEIVEILKNQYHKKDDFACIQAVYQPLEPLELHMPQDVCIKLLTSDYIDEVYQIYHHMSDYEYIADRINQKALWGLFQNDKLAGFIGMHKEGSMGMLEVKESYRRQGYGYLLEGYLINELLKQKKVPFCQVIKGNQASLALQKRLNMTLSSRYSYWVFSD